MKNSDPFELTELSPAVVGSRSRFQNKVQEFAPGAKSTHLCHSPMVRLIGELYLLL